MLFPLPWHVDYVLYVVSYPVVPSLLTVRYFLYRGAWPVYCMLFDLPWYLAYVLYFVSSTVAASLCTVCCFLYPSYMYCMLFPLAWHLAYILYVFPLPWYATRSWPRLNNLFHILDSVQCTSFRWHNIGDISISVSKVRKIQVDTNSNVDAWPWAHHTLFKCCRYVILTSRTLFTCWRSVILTGLTLFKCWRWEILTDDSFLKY